MKKRAKRKQAEKKDESERVRGDDLEKEVGDGDGGGGGEERAGVFTESIAEAPLQKAGRRRHNNHQPRLQHFMHQ
jgi:hypothetical protein